MRFAQYVADPLVARAQPCTDQHAITELERLERMPDRHKILVRQLVLDHREKLGKPF